MLTEISLAGNSSAGCGRLLADEPLPGVAHHKAWQAFLGEDFQDSLDQISALVTQVVTGLPTPDESSVEAACVEQVTVFDGLLLWARNLYQLDRQQDFKNLWTQALASKIVTRDCPELDVLDMGFAFKQGRYAQVVDRASEFINANRRDLPPVLADYLYMRGLCRSYLGDSVGSRRDSETAFALFRIQHKEYDGGRAANLLGILHFRSGEFRDAIKWFRRALELHAGLGLRGKMGGNRLNIGLACYKKGEYQTALTEFSAADELLTGPQLAISRCRLRIARGAVYRLLRQFDRARQELMQAYEEANRHRRPREEALALEFMGDVLRDEEKIPQARRYYSRALAIGRSIAPDGDIVTEVLRRQGECLDLAGRHHEALPVLGRALTLARRQGDTCEEGVIQRVLAEVMLNLGDLKTAAHYCAGACRLLRDVGARHELALALLVSANTRLAKVESGLEEQIDGLLDEAWQEAMAALDLFLKTGVDHWILTSRRLLTTISCRREAQEKAAYQAATQQADTLESSETGSYGPIIHVSARMRDLVQLCDAFAGSNEPVLITGETGTGKELFTRRLHARSDRRRENLVCVNVAAIPASMFEREFFGHVRGAFSGADRDSIGLAGQADGGTLFLDEIGELPLESQPKLLRLLQEGTYQAIGDPSERHVNIRLIAATNANLAQEVAAGRFRADLYYRLKILELRLPTITERPEDITPLLRHFLAKAAGRKIELTEFFNRTSLELMNRYSWPGNVREIAMVARQAWVQLSTRGTINVEVGHEGPEPLLFTGPHQVSNIVDADMNQDHRGRSRLLLALAEADGNRAEAARSLGISRSTLYRRMERFGILGKMATG